MNEYIEELIKFGFTEYEAKAYYVLLKNSDMNATEIAELSKIPRTKIYYVLENLLKKGMITKAIGKFKRFKAISPKLGLSVISQELETRMKSLEQTVVSLDEMFHESRKVHSDADFIEVLRDGKAIFQKMKQLNADVKSTVRAYHKSPYDGFIRSVKESGCKFTPGIKYRFIFEILENDDIEILDILDLFIAEGAEIRICRSQQLKMVIFDEENTMLSLSNSIKFGTNMVTTSLFIEHLEASALFSQLFDYQFEKAMTVSEFRRLYS